MARPRDNQPPKNNPPQQPPAGEKLPPFSSDERKRRDAEQHHDISPAAPKREVICPYCQIACKANRSEPYFTRYYCPAAGCSYSAKVPRTRMAQRVATDRAAEATPFDARPGR